MTGFDEGVKSVQSEEVNVEKDVVPGEGEDESIKGFGYRVQGQEESQKELRLIQKPEDC